MLLQTEKVNTIASTQEEMQNFILSCKYQQSEQRE